MNIVQLSLGQHVMMSGTEYTSLVDFYALLSCIAMLLYPVRSLPFIEISQNI